MLVLSIIVLSIVSAYPETTTGADIVPIGDSYIPLSQEEAVMWLSSISLDELVSFVILYDYVEHADALIEMPTKVIVEDKKGNLYIEYTSPVCIQIGHLYYEYEPKSEVIENFSNNKKKRSNKIIMIATSGSVGILVGILITSLVK